MVFGILKVNEIIYKFGRWIKSFFLFQFADGINKERPEDEKYWTNWGFSFAEGAQKKVFRIWGENCYAISNKFAQKDGREKKM